MKTFAVVIPTAGYREFDGNNYAKLPDGRMLRVIHAPGYPYAHLATFGAALRTCADKVAAAIPKAIVLELDSADGQWPGDAAMKAAIEKMGEVPACGCRH